MSGIKEALAKKQAGQAATYAALAALLARSTLPGGVVPLFNDAEVGVVFGIGRSTVWRRVAEGLLPRPVRFGKSARWRGDELAATVQAASEARDRGKVRVSVGVTAAAAAKRARRAAAGGEVS